VIVCIDFSMYVNNQIDYIESYLVVVIVMHKDCLDSMSFVASCRTASLHALQACSLSTSESDGIVEDCSNS